MYIWRGARSSNERKKKNELHRIIETGGGEEILYIERHRHILVISICSTK